MKNIAFLRVKDQALGILFRKRLAPTDKLLTAEISRISSFTEKETIQLLEETRGL